MEDTKKTQQIAELKAEIDELKAAALISIKAHLILVDLKDEEIAELKAEIEDNG